MPFLLKKILCFLFILVQFWGLSYAENSDDVSHQKALVYAKQQSYRKALKILQPLAHKYPKPNRYFYDFLSVLGWAGKYGQIASFAHEVNLQKAPLYVLKNLAYAQRQQKLFRQAERTYETLAVRFPKSIDSKIGLGLVLTDQRKTEKAEKTLLPLYKKYPNNIDLLYALAYLREIQNKRLLTLPLYEKILILNPSDRVSHKKRVLTLNQLGASHLAYSLIKNPALFSKTELARIKTDMAAHRLRWGEIPTLKEKDRFNETDQAINEVKRNITETSSSLGENSPVTLNNKFDLLVALRNRYKMREVVSASDKLEESGVIIPPYAKNAVCDALLYLDNPTKAEDCYLGVIKAGYGNVNAKIALFYALLENEKIPEAQQWIKKVAAEQPNLIRGVGKKKILKGNPKKTQAETARLLSIAFADDLDIANQQFHQLHSVAPRNTSLRKELANIYYWRGWPRKAQEEYEIGLHQEPKHLGLLLGQARNWLELKAYRKAEDSISQLFQIFPEDKGVAKQNRLWKIHNMREFKTDVSSSSSSGVTNGSQGLNIDSYLYSAPLDYHYRAYLHHRHSQASFTKEEGDGLLNHAGIGLEYSAPNIRLNGELHHNHYDNNRIGISFSGQYDFDDHLSAEFSLESLSRDTPLRALNQGIYSKSVSLGARYRWHESRSVGLNISYSKFSDSNPDNPLDTYSSEPWFNTANLLYQLALNTYKRKPNKRKSIGLYWTERWYN